jgi:hypothetical protein
VEGEILEGENAWYNEATKQKENIRKSIKFWSFPTILVIDLKRFTSNGRKDQRHVSFPITDLDLIRIKYSGFRLPMEKAIIIVALKRYLRYSKMGKSSLLIVVHIMKRMLNGILMVR